ncbi:hypothetical protein EAG_13680 [Camponotus floridanus]|uniref:Uncharacterized protein n=1 Tax=Camponotus floridanus TaxID=104421 RepID=E2A402_CAMFO|nr:hypothetical protein EAG_13680 [Camponotus floridanus]
MLAILGNVEQKPGKRAREKVEEKVEEDLERWRRRADGRQMSRAARPCDSFNQSLGCVPLGSELTTFDHATKPRPCYIHRLVPDTRRRYRASLPATPPLDLVPWRNLDPVFSPTLLIFIAVFNRNRVAN